MQNLIAAPAHERAVTQIMELFQAAEHELLGRKVATFRGATGTVLDLRLDNDHGLMFTFEPPELPQRRFYPVSTIRTL
jgi:hypothetical protein